MRDFKAMLVIPLILGALYMLISFSQNEGQQPTQGIASSQLIADFKSQIAMFTSLSHQSTEANRLLTSTSIQGTGFNNQVFSGTWNSNNSNPMGFFSGESGNILLELEYNPDTNIYQNLIILMYDPQYDDGKKTYIQFQYFNLCDQGNLIWICNPAPALVHEYERRSLQYNLQLNFTVNFEISQIDSSNGQGLVPQNAQIAISLTQGNTVLTSTLTFDQYDPSIPYLLYTIFISAFGLQQLYSANALTNDITQLNPAYSRKLSMLTVGFIIVYDSYVSVVHLYMSLEYTSYFYYFIIPTVIYFIMMSIVDMKLLIAIWKSRYYVNFETHAQVRKGFAIFYAKFYLSLIVFFTLTYQFYLYNEYVMIFPLFIVPQIVHNYAQGNSSLSKVNYLLGTLLSRAIIPIYYRGCPENIRLLTPSLWFSIIYPIVFLVLIGILSAQAKFGPRFFVPRRFKGGFNYYRTYQTSDPALMDDCPICMSKLRFEPEENIDELDLENDVQSPQNGVKLLKKKKIIVTQCRHLYHVSCFKAWINVKLECPSCRQHLPPLID